jgi:hypothetical protein
MADPFNRNPFAGQDVPNPMAQSYQGWDSPNVPQKPVGAGSAMAPGSALPIGGQKLAVEQRQRPMATQMYAPQGGMIGEEAPLSFNNDSLDKYPSNAGSMTAAPPRKGTSIFTIGRWLVTRKDLKLLEGNIVKSVILQDQNTGGTVLLGVAQYFDNQVNFKIPYDWDNLDVEWFVKELRDTLARDLDIEVKQMDISERRLLEKMKSYSAWMKAQWDTIYCMVALLTLKSGLLMANMWDGMVEVLDGIFALSSRFQWFWDILTHIHLAHMKTHVFQCFKWLG